MLIYNIYCSDNQREFIELEISDTKNSNNIQKLRFYKKEGSVLKLNGSKSSELNLSDIQINVFQYETTKNQEEYEITSYDVLNKKETRINNKEILQFNGLNYLYIKEIKAGGQFFPLILDIDNSNAACIYDQQIINLEKIINIVSLSSSKLKFDIFETVTDFKYSQTACKVLQKEYQIDVSKKANSLEEFLDKMNSFLSKHSFDEITTSSDYGQYVHNIQNELSTITDKYLLQNQYTLINEHLSSFYYYCLIAFLNSNNNQEKAENYKKQFIDNMKKYTQYHMKINKKIEIQLQKETADKVLTDLNVKKTDSEKIKESLENNQRVSIIMDDHKKNSSLFSAGAILTLSGFVIAAVAFKFSYSPKPKSERKERKSIYA